MAAKIVKKIKKIKREEKIKSSGKNIKKKNNSNNERVPKQQYRREYNKIDSKELIPSNNISNLDDCLKKINIYLDGMSNMLKCESRTTKVLMVNTSRVNREAKQFCQDLANFFSTITYNCKLRHAKISTMIANAKLEKYTHIMIISQSTKNRLTMLIKTLIEPKDCQSSCEMQSCPIFFFKIIDFQNHLSIKHRGKNTDHECETLLTGFDTLLGQIVSKTLIQNFTTGNVDFKGRKLLTLHNQRDFIFFRHHRYIFDKDCHANLQEIGPRFTLKLHRLFLGSTKPSDMIWQYTRQDKLKNSKKTFVL